MMGREIYASRAYIDFLNAVINLFRASLAARSDACRYFNKCLHYDARDSSSTDVTALMHIICVLLCVCVCIMEKR